MDPERLRAEGWAVVESEGFAGLVGPLWVRGTGSERIFGFTAAPQHGNRNGVVHGGMLMSFGDNGLGHAARDALSGALCATIQFQMQFTAPVRIGDFVVCRAEIVRRSLTLIFLRGLLSVRGKTVASADGVWAVLQRKPRSR